MAARTAAASSDSGPSMFGTSGLAFVIMPRPPVVVAVHALAQGLLVEEGERRLSIVYVGLGIAVCVAGSIVVALACSLLSDTSRRWLGIGLTSLTLLAWAALFPAVLHGPDGLVDAASAQALMGDIAEMQAVHDFSEAT